MIRIAYEREVEQHNLPKEVSEIIRNITQTLDSEYGENRRWKEDLGGIVLVLENESDLNTLTDYHLEPDEIIPEYVDLISANDDNWLLALVLLSSDYSITLIMPMHLAPISLINQIGNETLLEPSEAYGQ